MKSRIEDTFDHRTVVASDDPHLPLLRELNDEGVIDLIVFPNGVGAEKFAKWGYYAAVGVLEELGYLPRVTVLKCEVREHGANSAIYTPPLDEGRLVGAGDGMTRVTR